MVDILTTDQIAMLKMIGARPELTKQFYLAVFSLHHRYSEDLDFFSETEIDVSALNVFFAQTKQTLGFQKIDYQASLNRHLFFLDYPSGILKMEFTYFPFPRIEVGYREYGIDVDSQLDIAVNKLFTIYQRTKARDYIDLYLLCRGGGYVMSDLVKKARIKFDWHIDPIQLGTQFVKVHEATDLPRMIADVKEEEWREFFVAEAKKLKSEVFE
jgi:hypothetical protein